MIKNIIKAVCYRVYSIGKFEDMERSRKKREAYLAGNAIIEPGAMISPEGNIYNYQYDKNKIRIGSNTRIMGDLCTFRHGGEISIGAFCFVGPQTRIQSAKKIQIGDRVLIAHNVNIYDNITHPLNARERHLDFVHFLEKGLQEKIDLREKEIIIGDDVWIGFNCTILKGVKIGNGAIIGANTLINEDVPPYAVMTGNPAKIIKYTD